MGLCYGLPEQGCYDLSQLLVDERYQGRGYGKATAKLILEIMKRDGKYNKLNNSRYCELWIPITKK